MKEQPEGEMTAYIHKISTSVPPHAYQQDELRTVMKEHIAGTEREKKLIHRIYSSSGIRRRHSILGDFGGNGETQLYSNSKKPRPGTAARNQIYEKEGGKLFVDTARKTLADNQMEADQITHLITISCTGFYAPGPDYDIIRNLSLRDDTERYNLGFMGCYAAISGLKLASRICDADPDAAVLLVASELCTLHFQEDTCIDSLISSSVFSDGAAGTVIQAKRNGSSCYRLDDFVSLLSNEGKKEMAWTLGDTGFHMVLSTYIPELLTNKLETFMDSLLSRYKISRDQVDQWAVHPGGRAILDRIEQRLELSPEALQPSRNVLADYGNMSSPTILYVLREIFDRRETNAGRDEEKVLALAFGPGLTIESGSLTLLNG